MGVVTSLQTEYTEAKLHHFWFQYLVALSTAQIFTDGSAIGFTVFYVYVSLLVMDQYTDNKN